MSERRCTVPECPNPARSGSAEWCKKHYHRWYRHGSVDMVATESEVTASKGRRYRSLYLPGHPLATAGDRVYAHRAVLYDKIGEGPHPCHWCGTQVDWLPRGYESALQADHLNGVGDDNRADNLVPSCQPCNTGRASQARAQALVAEGWWSHHDTIASLKSHTRKPKVEVDRRGLVEDPKRLQDHC